MGEVRRKNGRSDKDWKRSRRRERNVRHVLSSPSFPLTLRVSVSRYYAFQPVVVAARSAGVAEVVVLDRLVGLERVQRYLKLIHV